MQGRMIDSMNGFGVFKCRRFAMSSALACASMIKDTSTIDNRARTFDIAHISLEKRECKYDDCSTQAPAYF